MKTFTKRLALVTGLLFTALICMGIVYIDTTQNYWNVSGGFVRLTVSNIFSTITISTNAGRFGFNTNNSTRSFVVSGHQPATNSTGNGTSGATIGAIVLVAGVGGESTLPTTASGGAGGSVIINGGLGASAESATTNATGGNGGVFSFNGGAGGRGSGAAATNAATGGNGGAMNLFGGAGGSPQAAATNAVGGNGSGMTFTSGAGGSPGAGWARKTGNSGLILINTPDTSASQRTNSGDVGAISIIAGNSGNVSTAPGNPGKAGAIQIRAGNGGTGDTNANGGSVYLMGGDGGSTAVDGDTVVGRIEDGQSRGGLQVGPLVTGTTATLTNLLTITATLDFPSIAAGVVADLPVAFAGAADGDVVTLGVPLSSVTNCTWMGFASNAVVYVRAANGQLVTAQDPNSGVFRIVLQKFR